MLDHDSKNIFVIMKSIFNASQTNSCTNISNLKSFSKFTPTFLLGSSSIHWNIIWKLIQKMMIRFHQEDCISNILYVYVFTFQHFLKKPFKLLLILLKLEHFLIFVKIECELSSNMFRNILFGFDFRTNSYSFLENNIITLNHLN